VGSPVTPQVRPVNVVPSGNIASMIQKILFTSILILLAGFSLALPESVCAQGRRVVGTTESGLQYEGKVFNFEKMSVVQGDSAPGALAKVVVFSDGLKRTFLNQNSLLPNIVDSTRNETEFEIWQRTYEGPRKGAAPFLFAEPFNDNGHRILHVRTADGPAQYIQGITKLNPRFVVVQSLSGGTKDCRSESGDGLVKYPRLPSAGRSLQ